MDRGGRIKLPNLSSDDDLDESIFGILGIYRRSTLHISHVTESGEIKLLKGTSSKTQEKDLQTSVIMKSKSRDQPKAANLLYLKMLRHLSSGGDPKERYSPIKLIDSGTFSHVVLAKVKKSEQNKMVAIKIMEVDKQPFTMLANEVTIMKRIRHENVVSCLDALYVEAVNKFWLVMQYVHGCSLTRILITSSLTEGQICYTAKQCVKGMHYLHQENIVHRDIKSNNILVDVRGNVKITDFGTSYLYDKYDKKKEIVGSPCWMAPEVVARKPYDFKIDVWSFGITLVEMIDGDPPHIKENGSKIMKLVKRNGRPLIKKYHSLSAELRNLLDKCLVVEPNDRATSRDLLRHEFLKQDGDIVTSLIVKT